MSATADRDQGERRELKALTSLRGLAAMAVVAAHYTATAQLITKRVIPSLVPHGYVAVDFFFVLSGFIMCYTYLDSFERGRPGAYRDFLARRVARILPLHVALVLLLSLAALVSIALIGHNIFFTVRHFWALDLAANLLLLPGIGIGDNFNFPSWSIGTEFLAYFLFPVLVWIVFNKRPVMRFAGIAFAAAVLIAYAARTHRLLLGGPSGGEHIVRCLSEFTLGMAAFQMYRIPRLANVLARDASALILSVLCMTSLSLRYDLPAALLFPFLVVAFAKNKGWPARFVELRPIYLLGVWSYSIYLIHSPFRALALGAARSVFGPFVSPELALLLAFLGCLAVIPFAWAGYTFIERPGRNFFRNRLAQNAKSHASQMPGTAVGNSATL